MRAQRRMRVSCALCQWYPLRARAGTGLSRAQEREKEREEIGERGNEGACGMQCARFCIRVEFHKLCRAGSEIMRGSVYYPRGIYDRESCGDKFRIGCVGGGV